MENPYIIMVKITRSNTEDQKEVELRGKSWNETTALDLFVKEMQDAYDAEALPGEFEVISIEGVQS